MIIVVGSAFIVENGSALLVTEKKSSAKGKLGLPGGKLEPGESIEDCVRRECSEELGRNIVLGDLLCITQKPHTHEGNTVIRFIYTAKLGPLTGDAELSHVLIKKHKVDEVIANNGIRGKDVIYLLKEWKMQQGKFSIKDNPVRLFT